MILSKFLSRTQAPHSDFLNPSLNRYSRHVEQRENESPPESAAGTQCRRKVRRLLN